MAEVKTLASGLGIGESPRWHDGRLWFSNWGLAPEIRVLDPEGNSELIAKGPQVAGFCLDFLADGRMLVTSRDALLRREPDRSFAVHADLGEVGKNWNEVTVDGRGNIYVNCLDFDFGVEEVRPGGIAVIRADGTPRRVADGVTFPNGMVVTPDNSTLVVAESWAHRLLAFDIADDGTLSNRRVWAEVDGDGICCDAEGAIWCSTVSGGEAACLRVRDGKVLERIETEAPCFACMLGGDDGRTLFMMTAEWLGPERMGELFQARTGKVQATRVAVPHAGHP